MAPTALSLAALLLPTQAAAVPNAAHERETAGQISASRLSGPEVLASALPESAKPHFWAAMNLYEANDFRGALLKFQLAYDHSSDPRLLWDIAICEKALGHYARALPLVQRYLSEARAFISEADRESAEELANAIADFVGPVRIECSQPGATVLIDDEEIGTTPLTGATPVDMGKHKITVRKRGFRELTQQVRVLGPTPEQHLTFRLERDIPASTLEVTAGHGQTITLDDTVVGYNRWEGLVSPMKHRVRVSGAGYKPKEVQVDLSDGRRASVWVVAQPLEPIDRTNRWPLVALLGSVTVVVGVVAYYGLRPGPRAQSSTRGELMTIDGFGKD